MPAHHLPVGSSVTTLHLCSDGSYLYWVWSPAGLNEKTQKGHSVFMDVFCLSVSRLLQHRRDDRPPTTTTLMALSLSRPPRRC